MRCPVRFGTEVWVFTAESTPGREPSTVFLMEGGYPDGASGMGRLPNRTCRGSVFAENFSNSGKLSLVPYTKDFGRITHF